MTNVVIQLTLKQLDERIDKAVAKAVAPLHEKIDKLNEKYNKLKNEFAELKYSLMYRDMAARVTTTDKIRKNASSQHSYLPDYLKRSARQENSKVDKVKQSLHPIAHGGTKTSSKNYHFQDKNIDKMHRAVYKSKMKREEGLKTKKQNKWAILTREAKQAHNAKWKKLYKQENPSVKTYSQTTSKRSSTPSVGSLLGRETVYKTVKPLHTVLKKNPQWHANRMGMMARSP
jgi:hypothetical protein